MPFPLGRRSPYNVSVHSGPARSYRRPYSDPVDAQCLSLLRRFLRKRASIICCLTKWLMPFASYPAFSQPSPYNALCILARQGRIDLPGSGPVDAQRLPRLQCFLRKRASVVCYLAEWFIPFASYPVLNQRSLYNAAVHSDQVMRYRLPCSDPVAAQHLPRLRRFLRKRASIICCLTKWLMLFASYPAFSQPSPYNASVHSDQVMWYRSPVLWPGGRTASSAPTAFSTKARFRHLLPN